MKLTYEQLKNNLDDLSLEGNYEMWLTYMWELLDKKGLTAYNTADEKKAVYENAYSMIKIYCDFVAKFYDTYSDIDGVYTDIDLSEFGDEEVLSLEEAFEDEPDKSDYIARVISKELGVNIMFVTLICAINDGLFYDSTAEDENNAIEVSSINELLELLNGSKRSAILDVLNDCNINNAVAYEWLSDLCG